MMPQSQNRTSRVVWIVICLGLIGGIACGTQTKLQADQQIALQIAARQELEALQRNAAAGDLAAITRLGIRYLDGRRGIARDVPKGLLLLNQAVGWQYAPAELILGSLYVHGAIWGFDGTSTEYLIPKDPVRGMELMKQSATHVCRIRPISTAYPALSISSAYRDSIGVEVDVQQADLWLARSILHCHEPIAQIVAGMNFNANPMKSHSKIDVMSFLLLMPPSAYAQELQRTLSSEDMQTAVRKMEALRQAVTESEKQYPAPPQPGTP